MPESEGVPDPDDLGRSEFWDEEASADRRDMRKQAVRWSVVFASLIAAALFAVWWATSALYFSASRVTESTKPTYRVYGQVRDARSGAPIPWTEVADQPFGQPPLFRTSADASGAFELLTLAEPHEVRISALGYRTKVARVGKDWFRWMPWGSERLDVTLQPE